MIALVVTIRIKSDRRAAFLEAMMDDARGSNDDEPGCLRFDVLQDNSDPNCISLYEVYRDQAALDAHRQAPHYLKWFNTVRDWFDGDVVRQTCTPIYPPSDAWR